MKLGLDPAKDGSLTETHSAPISCAVYNSKHRQVNIYFLKIIFFFIIYIKVNNMCR
jgi:hypothetical protein